jgi:hypothetical protein
MGIGYWWESQERIDHWEDQEVGGRIILRYTLEREDAVVWTGFIWLRIGTSELSGSIKYWTILEQLHNWQLFNKGSAPCR